MENKKIIGGLVGVPNPRSDWNQNDPTKADYIKNRPEVYTKSEIDTQIDKKADKSDVINVYKFKGSVENIEDFFIGENTCGGAAEIGDVYNETSTGMNYAWTGTEWDALSGEHKDFEHRDDKTNPHEVTAEQVGALPVEGGTLTGNLEVSYTRPSMSLKSTKSPGDYAIIRYTGAVGDAPSSLEVADYSGNNYTAIITSATRAKTDLPTALRLLARNESGNKYYNLYGEHNKPTAEDVGAYSKEEADALLDLKANKADIVNVYTYVGAVDTFGDLSNVEKVVGHVYNVRANGINYVWNGTEWDALGSESRDDSAHQRIDVLEEQKANISDVGKIESNVAGLNASVSGIEEELLNKADKSDVETNLELKADKSDVYKKDEVYNRSEIDEKLGEIDVNVDVSRSANALKGNASGEVISITDVSPIEHNLGVKMSSVNLLDADAMCDNDKNNCFVKNNDGSFTLTKIDNVGKRFTGLMTFNEPIPSGTQLCFSVDRYESEDVSSVGIQLLYTDDDTHNSNAVKPEKMYAEFKAAKAIKGIRLYISQSFANGTSVVLDGIQLKKGNSVKPYTPYVDVSTTTLKAQGKNLFNNDTNLLKKVVYYDANDEEFERIGYDPLELPIGTYTFTLIDDVVFTKYIFGYIVDENNKIIRSCHLLNNTNNQTPKTITVNEGERVLIINGHAGLQMEERKEEFGAVRIQLEVGESATSFEEYKEPTSYTPNADGTVEGVKSIYPSTTLATDTSGVLIECEYNKDTNKVIENLVNAIISLGGNV